MIQKDHIMIGLQDVTIGRCRMMFISIRSLTPPEQTICSTAPKVYALKVCIDSTIYYVLLKKENYFQISMYYSLNFKT